MQMLLKNQWRSQRLIFLFRFSLGKGSVMHFYGVRYEDGRLMFDRYLLLLGRGAGKTDISVMIVFIC